MDGARLYNKQKYPLHGSVLCDPLDKAANVSVAVSVSVSTFSALTLTL